MASKNPHKPRKKAKQARARETVDAILEATAHILRERGPAKLSTNAVAKRAGVSIGSLYQYFPNKESLVVQLARRRAAGHLEHLGGLVGSSLEEAVQAFVTASIASQRADPELQSAITAAILSHGLAMVTEDLRRARDLVAAFLIVHRDRLIAPDPRMAAWICVTTVAALVNGASIEDPAPLDDPAFAEEITRLVLQYLVGDEASSTTAPAGPDGPGVLALQGRPGGSP